MSVRVLLLGSRGMLAHDIIAAAPDNVDVTAPAEDTLDITNPAHLRESLRATEPNVVINAAGYTNVDEAERDPDAAFRINADAVGLIGRSVRSTAPEALVVHFSTDYVFSGETAAPYTEHDPTDPIGVYGQSKLAGEQALVSSGAKHLVIRTQWLFGVHGRSFPRAMWERATQGMVTRVVNDQIGRPTRTGDLAAATWRLVLRAVGSGGAPGAAGPAIPSVLHVANSGQATWYDVAERVFAAAGARELLTPCTTAEYPTPARRPAWSVLDTQCADALLGGSLPAWPDAVDRFLDELRCQA
jgi:dTDP-4-dehydrorhamnose reductase